METENSLETIWILTEFFCFTVFFDCFKTLFFSMQIIPLEAKASGFQLFVERLSKYVL